MTHELGRLEDLPADYVAAMRARNLVPLWPSLRGVLPPGVPTRQTRPTHWAYADIKPLLLQAGELTPIEKAERRVLVLANPGHTLEKMQASSAMYLGMQLLLPGEWAPSHRHTPNAVRMVVEGEGAWTTVEGEKCPMSRGDLILTRAGCGANTATTARAIWLDVLDLPRLTTWRSATTSTARARPHAPARLTAPALACGDVAHPGVRAQRAPLPLLRYPWANARAALLSMAQDQPGGLACVQKVTCEPRVGRRRRVCLLGFYAMMLRPGQTLTLPARSPAVVFYAI
ncbi:MAG: cupin domain-containing protein [Burkholderiaceae bacterium]